VLSASTPTTVLVTSLPADSRDAVRSHLRHALLSNKPDDKFSLRARAFAIRGRID
jgi:hypothetical protein